MPIYGADGDLTPREALGKARITINEMGVHVLEFMAEKLILDRIQAGVIAIGLRTGWKLVKSGGQIALQKIGPTGCKIIRYIGLKLCFSANTPVATEYGLRPIADIQPGERVWAYDFRAGNWRLSEVEVQHQSLYEGIWVTIDVEGSLIEATGFHPFWVVEGERLEERPPPDHLEANEDIGCGLPGRWVNSHDLKPADRVCLRSERCASVLRVDVSFKRTQVFNLAVREHHTFAVGEAEVLVHNLPSCQALSAAAGVADRAGFTRAGRSLTKHGAGKRVGNTLFPVPKGNPAAINKQAQEIVDEILNHPGSTTTQGFRPRFGNTIEIVAPDGRGIVYDALGNFLFFIE